MHQIKRQKFFILKSIRFSESDLILQCLSTSGEKLSFLARGAMRSRKRFAGGVLEPLHLVELTFRVPASDTQLGAVQEAVLLEDFKKLRISYEKLNLALILLNYIRKVSQEGDLNSEGLFNLLGHSLKLLEKESVQNFSTIKLQFLLKLLQQQGVLSFRAWMKPLLQFKLIEFNELNRLLQSIDIFTQEFIEQKLIEIENITDSYTRRAEGADESGCKFSTVVAR